MTKLLTARPFVICEVGSNWRDLGDCLHAIRIAGKIGADAVKFQAFNELALYGFKSGKDQSFSELPLGWLPHLRAEADFAGIEFMCTAFSPELVAAIDPYVNIHKIASSDATDPNMLSAVRAANKPVIISVGAASMSEVAMIVGQSDQISWRGFGPQEIVLMYCNAAYPSRYHNLFKIAALKKFGFPVGFSDHSTDVIYAPLSAVKHFGAAVIEKHVTFIDDTTPDSPHSLRPDEFQIMMRYLREKNEFIQEPSIDERDMLLMHRRRIVATKDLKAGDILEYGKNFGAFRSREKDARGMMPFFWDMFEGRKLKENINIGCGISMLDIQF